MEKNLLKKLEKTRQLMIESGMENGLQNPKTIRLSKKLDRLMNQIDDEPSQAQTEQHQKYIQ